MTWTRTARKRLLSLMAPVLLIGSVGWAAAEGSEKLALADGFDYPVGKPDGAGYYKSRGLRLRSPQHFGEDWNGRGGGDTDLGDPIYSIGDGIVTFAYDVRGSWGNVVIVRHAYRDAASGQVKFCDSFYAHLLAIMTSVGKKVKRGQQIATLGSNRGMYPAHLHFEIRHNIHIGMDRGNFAADTNNFADPTRFIIQYRRLNHEWGQVAVPTGTYQEYKGFKGL
ncbi:MAG: M23 family metallopeptidase, partial [Verrucomicrobiota bacterium]